MLHDDWQRYLTEHGTVPDATGPAGATWLRSLAVMRFRGADARSFLQGYLTSDTTLLDSERLQATAICNLKGRVVANGWCCAAGDTDVRLLVHVSLVARLTAFLRPYLTFAKTQLEDETPQLLLIGLLDSATATPGLELDQRRQIVPCQDVDEAAAVWQRATPAEEASWQTSLVEDRIPLITEATSEAFLPQMLGLDVSGAVSFSKGCYLGQEVVARAQHRGEVKRRLRRLLWEDGRDLEPGQEVKDASGRSVGTIVNAVTVEAHGQCLAVVQSGQDRGLKQGETDLRSAA